MSFFYVSSGTIFFLIPTTTYGDCSRLNPWNSIFCIFLLAPPLHNWFLHVYFAPSWVTLVFLDRTASRGKSEKQNKASFCPFHEPDSAPAALILMLFYAPVLNSNADNKLLFPWALCDSCERLRFTSCAHSHGEKGCWKGNSSDAGEHTGISGQTNWRKQDVFVRQNKWSNSDQPLFRCGKILKGVSGKKMEEKHLVAWVMSVVCNERCPSLPSNLVTKSSILKQNSFRPLGLDNEAIICQSIYLDWHVININR